MSSYKEGGFDRKYIISKANGNPVDPEAKYFVLRYDKDPCALMALSVYIKKIAPVNYQLAQELMAEIVPYWHLVDQLKPKIINPGEAKCHECTFKYSIPGNTHIGCSKLDETVKGDPHGINKGWFIYPILFDPIWMITECRNFEENK